MKKDKVDSILNTARQMFKKYGIQKTNLEDIARLSKVAKATIYNYFGSKDRVYMEVLNREVSDIASRISDVVEQVKSPGEKLRAFIFTSFRLVKEAADILNLRSDFPHRHLPRAGDVRKNLFLAQTAILQTILSDGAKKGVFNSHGPHTARSIVYAMRGFESTWLLDPDNAEIDADLNELFNILCDGILSAKRGPYA
ncbi:MAG: TetR/AcrR family transcriptional regulator [Thermodesulfobacteriota bacterium]|nr:TetR/AcrR family transcriptional regulator [Thermodesulfobacteriota bacterium]